ncbi:MAG TPA: non-reducing end alpha-L-arabinofuranosidase family hydrolase, partial [Polyangiaceae bacterium]|nr:non-reducing end alpha-L-arabinofuranosidase family hydrolase [Polyangiaceae bacterium]
MSDSLRLNPFESSGTSGYKRSSAKQLAGLTALVSAVLGFGCSSTDSRTIGVNDLVGGSASESPLGGSPASGGGLGSGGPTYGIGGASIPGAGSDAMGGSRANTGSAVTGGAIAALGSRLSTGSTRASGGMVSTSGGSGHTTTQSTGGARGTATGGANTNGGRASGGTTAATGASANGGSAAGGLGRGGTNGGGAPCPYPTSFKWSSSGPLAQPKSPAGHNFVSLKDFTHVFFNDQHIVYASVFDSTANGYSSVSMVFKEWSDMASANQTYMSGLKVGGTVAPTVFYFTPKSTWVLITQWGLSYATGSDPTDPAKWSARKNLLTNGPKNQIDPTVICDATNCYLFHAGDDGNIYRSSMPIGNFPGTFSGYQTILTDTQANLFEAVQVYSVKGTGEYLMIVEAMG